LEMDPLQISKGFVVLTCFDSWRKQASLNLDPVL